MTYSESAKGVRITPIDKLDATRETVIGLGARMGEEGRTADLTPAEEAVMVLTMTIDQLITKFQAYVEAPPGLDDLDENSTAARFEKLDEMFDDARMVIGRPWEEDAESSTDLVPCAHPGCPQFISNKNPGDLCLWHKA